MPAHSCLHPAAFPVTFISWFHFAAAGSSAPPLLAVSVYSDCVLSPAFDVAYMRLGGVQLIGLLQTANGLARSSQILIVDTGPHRRNRPVRGSFNVVARLD
jgi:hypothetical protein